MAHTRLGLLLAMPLAAVGLDNGLGLTPAMGYSSWNDCSSMRDNGPEGWCWDTEAHIKNITKYMIQSGLAEKGYVQVNIDEGWLKGRGADGRMQEDFEKFPSGMKGLGQWIKSQETAPGSGRKMRYGLYSCRGTCQCGTKTYHAVGSNGHEKDDVDWMVSHAGADYLKIDSCCGNQDHRVAFSDYAKFRDAMNATGTQVYFSLCGWHDWYAPPDPSLGYAGGSSLGNSWRIAGDGSGWGPLTNCINTQARVAQYAGPGGWNDPDLLIGPEVYVGGQSDEQARAQFTLWSIFPTNLLISQNMLKWSAYALETYSNEELIEINQDKLGSPAKRIVGNDLAWPCRGGPTNCSNVWGRTLSSNSHALAFVNNGDKEAKLQCDEACFTKLNISSSVQKLAVRDLWAHRDLASISRPFSFSTLVKGGGSAVAFKLTEI